MNQKDEALQDVDWVNSMHDELHQFVRNDVWELVPRPKGVYVIGTKWIFKNKFDEHGTVIKNKSRLVAQGYIQVEGVDYVSAILLGVSISLHHVDLLLKVLDS